MRHSEGYRGHSDRLQGFVDGLSERRDDVVVAEILSGQDQTSLTHQLVYKALLKRDNIVGIYSAGGGPAGVTPALETLGLAGKVIYIGHELTETSSQALRKGVQTLALDQNPEEQARQALGYLLKHFEYTTDFTLSPIPFSVISEETIENYQYRVEVPNLEVHHMQLNLVCILISVEPAGRDRRPRPLRCTLWTGQLRGRHHDR